MDRSIGVCRSPWWDVMGCDCVAEVLSSSLQPCYFLFLSVCKAVQSFVFR